PALAREEVRHLGEAVAMGIAQTPLAAQDAAELVSVDYEEMPSVTDGRAALAPDAPQVWPEGPGNLCLDWVGSATDPEAKAREVDAVINAATQVARVTVVNQRIFVASMETRGATASYDAKTDSYALRACSQSAGALRDNIIAIMNWPKSKLRVTTED